MAADTRPYKSKEQDGQGNEVIIRDQQLVEQSTVTTMPSGACFETLDIDGRPVKIPRDNMMSIVLECIGIVLNDSSKNLGTNVNKALGLQGNTIGNVTVNDFASVLGAPLYDSYIDDANNLGDRLRIGLTNTDTQNLPESSLGFVVHLPVNSVYSNFCIQIYYTYMSNNLFVRYFWGGWANWKQVQMVTT